MTLAEWSDRLALGDREALAELYCRYSGVALHVAFLVLRNRDDAEEIVQQTFLEVWQRATRYQPERSSPGTWISRIAKARAIDRLRRVRAQQGAVAGLALEPPGCPDPLFFDAETVRLALGTLSIEQARVVELAYYQGLSHSEISVAIGSPLGTAKTRLRRAVVKLAGELADPSVATLHEPGRAVRWPD